MARPPSSPSSCLSTETMAPSSVGSPKKISHPKKLLWLLIPAVVLVVLIASLIAFLIIKRDSPDALPFNATDSTSVVDTTVASVVRSTATTEGFVSSSTVTTVGTTVGSDGTTTGTGEVSTLYSSCVLSYFHSVVVFTSMLSSF